MVAIFGLYALYAWFWETLPPNISWAGSFFLWPQNLTQNLLGITWTLSFELYFYLGTAILLLSNRTRAGKVLAIFGIALLAINVVLLAQGIYRPENAGLAMSTVLVPFYLSPLALEFIAGFLLADFLHRAPNQKISHWLSGACLAFVAGYSYQYVGQLNDSGMAGFYHTVERCLLFGSFAACTVASAVLLEKKDLVPPHFLKLHALGNASYSIYLSHLLVIALCGKAYMAHQPQLQWPMGLWVTAVVALVLLGSWLNFKWIEHPLYAVMRKLLTPTK